MCWRDSKEARMIGVERMKGRELGESEGQQRTGSRRTFYAIARMLGFTLELGNHWRVLSREWYDPTYVLKDSL